MLQKEADEKLGHRIKLSDPGLRYTWSVIPAAGWQQRHEAVMKLWKEKKTPTAICAATGLSLSAVYRIARENNYKNNQKEHE